MALLRRRNWPLTVLLAGTTVLAYAAIVFWARPGFLEKHYNTKQRLWAQFLSTCDCQGPSCSESFDLTLMHGSLYEKMLVASQGGNRSVVQHLVWQPHKLGAAYPWRLRMYAHMALMLPRSLALMHMWWLAASEELAVALHHLAQGVPLFLDPDAQASLRVEPDAVMLCSLEGPTGQSREPAESEESNRDPVLSDASEQLPDAWEDSGEAEGGDDGADDGGSANEDDEDSEAAAEGSDREKEQAEVVAGGEGDGEEAAPGPAGTAAADNNATGGRPVQPRQQQQQRRRRGRRQGQGRRQAQRPGGAAGINSSLLGDAASAVDQSGESPAQALGARARTALGGDGTPPEADDGAGMRQSAGGGGTGEVTGKGPGGGGKRGAGGRKGRGTGQHRASPELSRFRCGLLEVRGAAPLLRLLPPPPPPSAAPTQPPATTKGTADGGKAAAGAQTPPPSPSLPASKPPLLLDGGDAGYRNTPQGGKEGADGTGTGGTCAAASIGGGDGSATEAGSCSAAVPASGGGAAATASAAADAAAAGAADAGEQRTGPDASGGSTDGGGGGDNIGDGVPGGSGAGAVAGRPNGSNSGAGRAGRKEPRGGGGGGGGGKGGRFGRRQGEGSTNGDGSDGFVCRNHIYVRPPLKSEVSEHVRDTEASPLGLPPLEFLRRMVPRAAELAGWCVVPHVMLGRYVLLMAPPALDATAASAGYDSIGTGGGMGAGGGALPLPLLHVGTQLMLAAGALLTLFELQLWWRVVVSELLPLGRRPPRSWARRRQVAVRVLYEGMAQPLREALLFWNVTHFVVLPLLQLVLSAPALDGALLPPLAYCVVVLGAANSDVAARASAALLRVARRARQHEGGYQLQLLSIVAAVEPRALPYTARLMLVVDSVGNVGRAAVAAALLEEAPAVAAALAAAAQRRRQQADGLEEAAAAAGGAADGAGGAVHELAAAMRARVAPAAAAGGRHQNGGGGGGAEEEEYDTEEEEVEEDERGYSGRQGRPVVLRWPAPLQFSPEVHDWEDVPRGFTCAITQQLMAQPAMLVSPELPAAPTYERAAIQQWLAGQMRDPKSNTPLRSYSLLPNEDLHRAIDDWVSWRLRNAAGQETAAAAAAAPAGPSSDPAKRNSRRTSRKKGTLLGRLGLGSGARTTGAGAARWPSGPEAAAAPSGGAGATGAGPSYGAGLSGGAGGAVAAGAGADSGGGGDSEGVAGSYSEGEGSDWEPGVGTRSRSGGYGAGPTPSTSVLASLAQGASSVLEAGVEVVSRGAAAAAAAVGAVTARRGGGGGGGGGAEGDGRDDVSDDDDDVDSRGGGSGRVGGGFGGGKRSGQVGSVVAAVAEAGEEGEEAEGGTSVGR